MIFLGVYRWPGSSSARLVRSQQPTSHQSQRSSYWELPPHRSHSCAGTGTAALTEEDRFMRAKERALIEQAAMRKAKDIIDRSENLHDAVEEARWQYKVCRRAKEILEDLGG